VISAIFLFFAALMISFLLTYPLVGIIRLFGISQAIREEGPKTHQAKAGTPTMGGMGFVVTILVFGLVFIDFQFDFRYLALILLTFGFAAVGFIDDLIKIIRKQNQGLTFWQKIILQTIFAAAFSGYLVYLGHYQSIGEVLGSFNLFSIPIFYFLLSTLIIIGTANATNLTDGLNGLLAGTGSIAFLAFGILAYRMYLPDAWVFCFAAAGAIIVFLYFNFPKAKIFMGDVGSLAIGAALAGIAIIMHKELRLMVIGGVFLIEALSVILQVTSYKLFRKRIFKMSPLHHHFELMGIKETYVVVGFWVVGIVLGVVGVLI